jgi:ABC-type histidine transport system ATPase subunit
VLADGVVFLDDGRVLEAGDTSVLEAPAHPRLRQFLQLLEITR